MRWVIFITKKYWKAFRYLNFAISFGLITTVGLLAGYYGGSWLDRKFGTAPFLMLIGVLLGIASSFYALFQELRIFKALESYDLSKLKDKNQE